MANIAVYVQVIQIIAYLSKAIYDLIKELDDINTNPGTGPDKMALIMSTIQGIYSDMQTNGVAWDKVEPLLQKWAEGLLKLSRKMLARKFLSRYFL